MALPDAALRATNLRSPGAAPRAMRPAPVRAGALHAPDIVPVAAADAARFAASARRRRCMATSGSPCAPRATRTAARCGASSFRPAHPGGSMSPSATRPASRRAKRPASDAPMSPPTPGTPPASPSQRRPAIRRASSSARRSGAPSFPRRTPQERRNRAIPMGAVGSPPNRASWGGAGAPGAPGGAAPDRSRPHPPPRAGMGARRPAPDHCAAASGAAAPSAH